MLVGSHSDTQATGGWLDGALGMVYALEACRAVKEAGGPPLLDLINFQDEEGRFGSLVGSTAFCGGEVDFSALSLIPEAAAPSITLAEAAAAHPELDGKELLRLPSHNDHGYFAFLEAHIEQGRKLERSEQSVGVVSSIVGLRQLNVQFWGEQNHAGSTAMVDRKDAAVAAFEFATQVGKRFRGAVGPDAHTVWTFGQLSLSPGAASIIPGHARLTIQFRDPSDAVLDTLEATLHEMAASAATNGSGVRCEVFVDRPEVPAIPMDPAIAGLVAEAAEECLPNQWQHLHSGAIHDAGMMASRMPSAMMFIPSINGISHDFTEDTAEHDIAAGAQVYAVAAANIVEQILQKHQ